MKFIISPEDNEKSPGNLAVFLSSRLYNAVNVDSVSIVFIEMLAIIDLLIAVSYSLPVAVTLFAKKYILGKNY